MGIARPNSSQAVETNECAAKCDQGDGSPDATQKFSDCVQGCIASLFPSSQTGSQIPGAAASSAAGSGTGASGTGASGTGASGSANPTASTGTFNIFNTAILRLTLLQEHLALAPLSARPALLLPRLLVLPTPSLLALVVLVSLVSWLSSPCRFCTRLLAEYSSTSYKH